MKFVQTHVILTILRMCWGGSVLQLLTPDPVNPLNPATKSKLCKNHMLSQSKRALTPQHLQFLTISAHWRHRRRLIVLDSVFWIQDPGCRILDPGSCIQDPGS